MQDRHVTVDVAVGREELEPPGAGAGVEALEDVLDERNHVGWGRVLHAIRLRYCADCKLFRPYVAKRSDRYLRCYLDTVIPRYQTATTAGREKEGQMSKAMTLRLDEAQARELEAVARVERIPVSELVREAIDAHIAARREDTAFRDRLRTMLNEDREILARLAQ